VDIVKRFEEKGQLDNTYFVFTSDNGYRHGEHAMVHGKLTPYEEDINAPLFVRGPDVSKGARLPNFALNTDRAPTFCEWAGISPCPYMDGRSLAPLSAGDKELHDIREDPYQLNNLMDDGRPPPISGSASRCRELARGTRAGRPKRSAE
jgi:arylsulfatase A-like enzyme